MRFARIQLDYGAVSVVHRDGAWAVVDDVFAAELRFTGEELPLYDSALLSPVMPRVVVGISHNLTNNDHALPIQAFLKSPRTIANPGDEVPFRDGIGVINMEAELAIVVGKRARHLTIDNALDVVFGYTVGNDVTNAGQVAIDEKFTQVKNGDRYTPLGPWIETELEHPDDREIRVCVNGEVRLTSSTANLPSNLADVLIYVTEWMELGPGDVVLTGAPNTSVAVRPGDVVDCEIDGLGTLRNRVS